MSEPTCQQRIADHLKSREEDIGLLMNASVRALNRDNAKPLESLGVPTTDESADDIEQYAYDALAEYPLAVSTYTTLRVDLSTGGPADYLTCTIETGKYGHERMSSVRYHFADWFDHADVALDEDSPLVQWVDSIVEVWQP